MVCDALTGSIEVIGEVFEAIFKLAIPVAVVSWLLLSQLYNKGELNPSDDNDKVNEELKKLRKRKRTQKTRWQTLAETKWMQFGGGFYGTAGLWTFITLELNELYNLITDFPTDLFANGLVSLLVSILINQIQNFVTAIVWFTHWGGNGSSIAVWFAAAYFGFQLGLNAAKRRPWGAAP